jgi:hypothetical protein
MSFRFISAFSITFNTTLMLAGCASQEAMTTPGSTFELNSSLPEIFTYSLAKLHCDEAEQAPRLVRRVGNIYTFECVEK